MSETRLEHVEEALRHALDAFLGAPSEGALAPVEEALKAFEAAVREAAGAASSLAELAAVEQQALRQKGALNQTLRSLGPVPGELRKVVGAAANRTRAACAEILAQATERLEVSGARERSTFDVTLPGRNPFLGRPHVLNQVRDEVVGIFRGMGYSVAENREVEDDHHNFGALNFGPHHPARDAHDTLFVEGGALMRTHTSPVQIRTLESQTEPCPVRMLFPGRVYRAEQIDATHASEFHQVEGLYVDRGVSMAHLKGALSEWARAFFGARTRTRFRPSYFPFTEPSGEMDVSCFRCEGSGRRKTAQGEVRCNLCKGSGWIEILGCGMVHPNVFRAVNYDPEVWTGFAFGIGIERIAMLRYGISDIRHFLESDLNFLEQF